MSTIDAVREPLLAATCALAVFSVSAFATTESILIGMGGLPWESGGGNIPATVILSETTVDETNTPGGVIDFDSIDRSGWIFPQQADTSDNILLDIVSRGGEVFTPLPSFRALQAKFPNMFDDNGNTALVVEAESAGSSAGAFGLIVQFDLGATFGINRLRFFPRNAADDFPSVFANQRDFIKGYELFVNDGAPQSVRDGALIWDTIALEGQNEEAVVDLRIPTRFVRFIRLKSLSSVGFEIAEMQVFSDGFVPQATYVSNVFDFGESAILGNLRWIQEQLGDPERSEVRIRTRSGNDLDPVEYTRIGQQPSGRVERRGATVEEIPIDAPWKPASEVEDGELADLIATVLDDPEGDGRESLLVFKNLPPDDRQLITLDNATYFKIDKDARSAIRDDLNNWSAWSPPYPLAGVVADSSLVDPVAGVPIIASGTRRYFQFMVEFANETFNAAAGVGALAFDVSRPVFADSLVAEIFPRSAILGQETDFTYAVLYTSKGEDVGFDRLRISTPLLTRSIGNVEIHAADGSVLNAADFSGISLVTTPVANGDFTVTENNDTGFTLDFPHIDQSGTLVRVQFRSTVLRVGTRFGGVALNEQDLVFGQPLEAGNAADLSNPDESDPDSDPIGTTAPRNLFVDVPVIKKLLVNVNAQPAVFTPNGDGVNETVLFVYDITNIARPTQVSVEIFDLSGRRIKIFSELKSSGRFTQPWDGRNEAGEKMPPGNYLYIVVLDAGTGAEKFPGVVSLAY